MSEPQTKAGRRLLAEIDRRNFEAEPFNMTFGPKDDWLAQAIAQVEQEARADLAAAIVAAVEKWEAEAEVVEQPEAVFTMYGKRIPLVRRRIAADVLRRCAAEMRWEASDDRRAPPRDFGEQVIADSGLGRRIVADAAKRREASDDRRA